MRWLFALSVLVSCAHALHQSEAGIVDWHQAYVGVPFTDSLSTAPAFHPKRGRPPTEALLLAATSSNVLAALHPTNGTIAWRFIFEPSDSIVYYQRHDDVVVSLSGPGGATLRIFEASSGHLLAEKRLHPPQQARLLEPSDFGASVSFIPGESDAFVLTSGHTLRRIDSTSQVKWTWSSPDQTSLVIYSKLVATPSRVYAVGLASSFASYTLHVTSISTSTGEQVASANIPSSITEGPNSFLTLSSYNDPSLAPRVAWLEGGSIHSVALSPELRDRPTINKGASFEHIVDVGLGKEGHFVAIKHDGSGHVLKLDEGKTGVSALWEFSDSARSDRYTESFYVGGVDKDGRPYVGRVFWSHTLHKGSVHIYAPHLGEGKGLVSGFTFPFDTDTHGIMTHAALHVAYVKDVDLLPYVAITTSTGVVQLWQGDILQWSREEGLSRIQVAEMVELPEPQTISTHAGLEHETFVQRLTRQLSDAREFPQYLVHFIKRFATGSYASATSRATPSDASLSRDAFGFRKIVVVATDLGKVYGLDSSNGQILWSRVLSLGWAAQVGGQVIPVKLFVTRTVGDEEEPQVVLVTQRKANNGLVDTVLFHIDALTGEDALKTSSSTGVLEGIDIISGPAVEAYLLEVEDTKVVVLLDEFLQVYLYPDTPETDASFRAHAPKLHLPLRTGTPGARQFTGHALALSAGLHNRAQAYPTWTTSLPPTSEIISVLPLPPVPVASLGKVLGNRTTLYKYLNPHLFVVTSWEEGGCGVRVLDGVKGSVIYDARMGRGRGNGCDVKAAFAENWLVYVYWEGEYQWTGQSKGRRVVSVEFYEGKGPDDKTRSSDMSSSSEGNLDVSVYEQAFVFPHGVRAMSMTRTKFGVTVKDLVVANDKGQIQTFTRVMLDPRRPKRKTTAEEQEEMLVQYDPLIPDDPRRVLSHEHEVANVRHILISPALLESTSLVFAYGLDLFATRVAPSGTFDVLSAEFNKAQLVLTVCGLALAIGVSRPMVRRKRLRERWYK